jgi:RNA polymerase sigma-70 factor (ECF subfamily)
LEPDPEDKSAGEETFLLARAGSGDREAFRELYSRYSGPLFSVAVRLMGNRPEAEEQLQDAFVKIWQNASSFDRRKSRPFTWAVTITRRTCIDRLRRRRNQVKTTTLPGEAEASMASEADKGGPGAAEAREDSARLRGALSAIPQGQRSALELALFSEMTHAEIAQRLEQPVGTVKSWIRRGLLGLRATLADTSP